MEDDLIQRFNTTESIVVSGDCRMDSPGFSAIKGTYTLMDHDSGTLLSMEHRDKRQVICCYIVRYCSQRYDVAGQFEVHQP